jgi:Leu/Phe-tRNA-protein transferase
MRILEKAIETYGKDMQLTVAIEEFSELIKEICKNKRGSNNRANIIEEMADCYVMLHQISLIFGVERSELDKMMNFKIARLANRLRKEAESEGEQKMRERLNTR